MVLSPFFKIPAGKEMFTCVFLLFAISPCMAFPAPRGRVYQNVESFTCTLILSSATSWVSASINCNKQLPVGVTFSKPNKIANVCCLLPAQASTGPGWQYGQSLWVL